MKILLCHNYYQQRGGEDESFEAEARLLEDHGHQVARYTVHNDVIHEMRSLDVARRAFWNPQTTRELRTLIRSFQPDVMHCTNIFPLISPAAYGVAREAGVPVVQSLHNYRLFCSNALFFRDGKVCEECLGKKIAWPALKHKCYRDSRAATAVVAGMSLAHQLLGTWDDSVSAYTTLTEFSRRKLIEGGIQPHKVLVKPNFIDPDPGPGPGNGGYAVFVSRLSAEKGLDVLIEAWRTIGSALPLKIIGDGPLRDVARQAARDNPSVEYLGRIPLDNVLSILGEATCLVMPSIWYETFGRTIIEAFSRGTPVVASRLGAMQELVDDGRTGAHFQPGDAADLAAKTLALVNSGDALRQMRAAARAEYLAKYTAQQNIVRMLAIYEHARRCEQVSQS